MVEDRVRDAEACSSQSECGRPQADCWQTGCKASSCSLSALQTAGDFTWTASLSGISQ